MRNIIKVTTSPPDRSSICIHKTLLLRLIQCAFPRIALIEYQTIAFSRSLETLSVNPINRIQSNRFFEKSTG